MKLTLKKIRRTILIIILALLSGGMGFWLRGSQSLTNNSLPKISINRTAPADKQNLDFSLFWEVWDKLQNSYIEKKDLDQNKMVYGAIAGMTASLGDPYTVFLPPSDNQASKEDLNGEFDGVGIQLGYKDGNRMVVVAPLSGMPAEKAGVQAGDYILHIKDDAKGIDMDTQGLSLPEAVKNIRGSKSTNITLTLLHEGASQPYSVELKRDTIIVPSVEVKFGYLDNGSWKLEDNGKSAAKTVAWLKLSRFGDLTNKQWDQAVDKIINNSRCTGVILDLRNNPGGYLNGAVSLASEFLDEGTLVVKQENADGSEVNLKTNRPGRLVKTPLFVLVNKGSASASEILAGALRDWNRGKIVGENSFGKGTVQEAMDLRGGAGLHVTTAKWLLPKGEWINKTGIAPDITVAMDEKDPTRDLQLEKGAEILLK